MAGDGPLLEARAVTKSFPGVRALEGVDLACHSGTVHAVVGENGAGKSTLINILTGIHQPDAGGLYWQGRRVRLDGPRQALANGIAAVYQELAVLPHLSVLDNVLLGQEVARRGVLRRRAARERVRRVLGDLGLHRVSPDTPAGALPAAGQQIVEIARALVRDARLLILDEPSAVLAGDELARLFDVIRRLAGHGVSVVYISHRLQEVGEIADLVTIMRDGRVVSHGPAGDYDQARIVREMVGRDVDGSLRSGRGRPGEVVLNVRGMLLPGTEPDGLTFHIRAGEVVGLAGLAGSGRSRIARALMGLESTHGGSVHVRGRRLHRLTMRTAARHGMALIPEERKTQGLVLGLPLAANVALPVLRRISRAGFVSGRAERKLTDEAVRRLSIRTAGPSQLAGQLSGGNQQKVVLAKWLGTDPSILLLDEPTRGVDVGAKAEIYHAIDRLSSAGLATLLISSELPELLGLADRVLVVRDGRIAGEVDREHATEESVMAMAVGETEGVAS